MTRQAIGGALAALLAGQPPLTARPPGAPVVAGARASQGVYTCGTDGPAKRTEGRVETWHLVALSFMPDSRSIKPLLIPYKAITRLEFGPTPGNRAEPLIKPPCSLNRQGHYLTIFYKLSGDVEQDSTQSKESKDAKASKQSKEA